MGHYTGQALLQAQASPSARPTVNCPPQSHHPIVVLGTGVRLGCRMVLLSKRQLSPVLTPLLVGIRNEIALGLGVIVVL